MDITGVGQIGNFFWWEGVVEDNLDPTGAGRCKVRVIGHNTLSKTELPTEHIPWAYPLLPLNNPHGKLVALKPGTRVMGFYRDGKLGQDLVMLGTINTGYANPGNTNGFDESQQPVNLINLAFPVERIGEVGGVDDRVGAGTPIQDQPQKLRVVTLDGTIAPTSTTDYGEIRVNEINTPRLARGIEEATMTQTHRLDRSTITTTTGDEIVEPETPYAALYPYNTVEESDSGHIREVDDTPNAERIKETHRTGTFYEIHPNGSKVTKVVGDDFSVTIRDKNVKIEGVCNVNVVGNVDLNCGGNVDLNCDGDTTVSIGGDTTVSIGGDATVSSEGDATVSSEGDATVSSGGGINLRAGEELVVSASDVTFAAGGNMTFAAGGTLVLSDSSDVSTNVSDLRQRS